MVDSLSLSLSDKHWWERETETGRIAHERQNKILQKCDPCRLVVAVKLTERERERVEISWRLPDFLFSYKRDSGGGDEMMF